MNDTKLTAAQVALLRAVAAGQVSNMGSHTYYGRVDGGRHQKLTARVVSLRDLGLINPYGVAIKRGKPMPATEEFADHSWSPSPRPASRHSPPRNRTHRPSGSSRCPELSVAAATLLTDCGRARTDGQEQERLTR